MNYQNQYPMNFNNNPNDQLTFGPMGNSENIYSQAKEEEVRVEINTVIRLGFIRKVYGILSIQLFITTIFCIFSMTSKSFKEFMLFHRGLFYLMLFILIVFPILIVCCQGLMRQVPQNYIILLIFTLAESYAVGFICAFSKPEVVFMAAMMTFIMVLSLTFYAINTKTDITTYGGLIFIFSSALLLLVIFGLFIRYNFFHVLISLFFAILFAFYIIYDTQLIMGNRQEMIQVDDYILGAFIIYTDIINLFLELLRILSYFTDN